MMQDQTNSTDEDSSHTSDPKAFPFTFGIEVEFLYLQKRSKSSEVSPSPSTATLKTYLESDGDYQLREKEAVAQLALKLTEKGLEADQHAAAVDYKMKRWRWHITSESAVKAHYGEYCEKIPDWTDGKVVDLDDWTSDGLELISRVFEIPHHTPRTSDHPSLEEIRKYIEALHAGPRDDWHCVSAVENGSIHVHVGLPQYNSFEDSNFSSADLWKQQVGRLIDRASDPTNCLHLSVKIQQHLAYIAIVYEDIISMFHHPERHGKLLTKTWDLVGSVRAVALPNSHTCGKLSEAMLQEIRTKLFRCKNLDDLDVALGGIEKQRIIAFPKLGAKQMDRTPRPPTVEFRQHQGTLEWVDIKQWIIFVVAMMRAAERMALFEHTPKGSPGGTADHELDSLQISMKQTRKYDGIHAKYESTDDRIEELFDILDLSRTQRRYWRARAENYNLDIFTDDKYAACDGCDNDRRFLDGDLYQQDDSD